MAANHGVTFALDTPEAVPVGAREYVLKGWCFHQGSVENLEVFVVVNAVETPAFMGLSRPDVARHHQNQAVVNSGFVVRFRCPPQMAAVALFARVHGVEFPLMGDIKVPALPAVGTKSSDKVSSYSQWLAEKEPDLFWRKEEIPDRLAMLSRRPLISIILPTYNTPAYFLKRCVESVLEQHYGNWQLCVADDSSSEPAVFAALGVYAALDQRIDLQRCDQQCGISRASNLALEKASGDFVVLLDHDDELHPYALLELVRAINAQPDCQFFYSDEDKIDEWGIRSDPAFKPDFDENVFFSFNYLGHMIGLKRSLVKQVSGFRSECDGAQDWDLLIRAMEVVGGQNIQHIRKPLYHWRKHVDSTAQNLDAKPYVAKAWARVLGEHISRTARNANLAEGIFFGSLRLQYKASRQLQVAVIIRPEDGAFQAATIQENAGLRPLHLYQLVEATVTEYAGEKSIASISEMKGDVFVFINGPLESISHLFFDELVSQAMRPECGVVTGLALESGGKILATGFVSNASGEMADPYAGISFPSHGYMGQINISRELDWCPAAFFAVRRERLAQVGGLGVVLGSRMQQLAGTLSADAIKKGLAILFTPYAVATFAEKSMVHIPFDAGEKDRRGTLKLNPQILTFENSKLLLQGN